MLYGSESELDSDEEEDQPKPSKSKAQNQRKFEGARLRVDNDEPMDLLQGAATQVTSRSSIWVRFCYMLTLVVSICKCSASKTRARSF